MSIEKEFDNLDEKISALLRSIGIIITLLLGVVALGINYFKLNITIGSIFLILMGIFITNIIYPLYLYIVTSTKKDDFLNKLNSYVQILRIFNDAYKELIPLIHDISKMYFVQYAKTSTDAEKKELLEYLNLFSGKIYIKEEDGNSYTFHLESVEQIRLIFNYFRVIYVNIGTKTIDNPQYESLFNKIETIIEIIDRYVSEIIYYEDIKFFHLELKKMFFPQQPLLLFDEFLDHCRLIINKNYREMNNLKKVEKDTYRKKIIIAYLIYGLSIIFSCVFLLSLVFVSL